jgi:hypothetical protein
MSAEQIMEIGDAEQKKAAEQKDPAEQQRGRQL